MTRILTFLLCFLPIAATPIFSDFDPPKWALLSLGTLAGVALLWGRDRRYSLSAPGFWIVGLGVLGTLTLTSMMGSARTGNLVFGGWQDQAGLGLAFGVMFFASRIPRARSSSQQSGAALTVLIFAGAFAPMALLVAQGFLDLGINPLKLPHKIGVFSSTMGNSGLAGELAVLSLAFLAWLPARIAAPRARFATVVSCLAGIFAVIWLSESRAAMVAAILIGAFLWLSREKTPTASTTPSAEAPTPKIWWRLAGAGIFLTLASVVVFIQHRDALPTSPFTRLASVANLDRGTNLVRIELAKDSLAMFRDHPWFGVGGRSFVNQHGFYRSAKEWRLSGLRSQVLTPHCEPLRALSEYGLLGSLALLLGLGWLLRDLTRNLRSEDLDRRRGARTALAALLGICTTGLFWFSFQVPSTLTFAAVAIGLGLRPSERKPAVLADFGLRLAMTAAILICAFLSLSVAKADYEATSHRDQLEALKREIRDHRADGNLNSVPTDSIRRLGEAAGEILPILDDWRLSTPMRYRLLLALANLAEERQKLDQAARGLGLSGTNNRNLAAAIGAASAALPRPTQVLADLETAHKRAPGHLGTLRLLAEMEFKLGRRSEAIGRLEQMIENNHDAPLLRPMLALPFRDDRAKLYHEAANLYRTEIEHYPLAPESDGSWRGLAECLGAAGNLEDALKVVERWNLAQGDHDSRWAVAGAISLHFGETSRSLGRFRDYEAGHDEKLDLAYQAEMSRGLEAPSRRVALLATLGHHPENIAALSGLQDVLSELISSNRGRLRDDLEAERNRALSRAKVLYALDHFNEGNERLLRISLRQARRFNPRQGDSYLIELIHQTRNQDWAAALQSAEAWYQQGFRDFDALLSDGDLETLWVRPEWEKWRKSRF